MALLGRDTSVTGPFPKGVLLLETLKGQEVLGRPYKFQLSFLSKEPDLAPDDVIGKPLAVGIQLVTGEERFFHGIVTSFAKVGTTHLHTRYVAELRSMLNLFDHTLDCRIFNDPSQDALAIITAVLAQRGLTDIESGAIRDHVYRKREYCVQYRESDLRFVQRLLEEEGIYYFFKHEEAKHTLVFADSITGHETVAGYESILYTPEERRIAGSEEHFWNMKVRRGIYPGRHTVLSGYDPTALRPKQQQFGRATSEDLVTAYPFEHYDYPGGLIDPEEAQQEADLRAQAGCVDQATIEVDGNTLGLGLGHLVSLRPSPDSAEYFPFWSEEDFGKQYLVVGATYSLSIDQLETGDVAGSDEPFKAKYQLQDSQVQFRPQQTTAKPRMNGPQTALVVGPSGEEIWTDKFGRVMVQFDWDRLGTRNEKSSCWVRVAQAWAGARWGAQYLPRVGQEVIVTFLDGDPDRPIVRGHVYNKDNMPPYNLPANQTQSGIKSRSSKGGTASNFNEIRFEDKKGHEELHLQAEKDMSTLVKNNQTLHVGTDRIIVVGNDETNLAKNDRQLTVDLNDNVVIGGTHDKTVTDVVTQIYGSDHSRKVDGQQELFAEKNKDEHVKQAHKLTTDKKFQLNQGPTSMTFKGSNVTVDSAGTITLQAGGATVCLDKSGKATFDSPTGIKFVVGGSSLSILPGGVVLASPAVTAAAGGAGSVVSMGEEAVAMKSKTVTIEAAGVCSIKGKSSLKLQEAEPLKGKKSKASPAAPPPDESQDAAPTMSHSLTSGPSAGEAPSAIPQTKKQNGEPSAALPASDAQKDPAKKLTVHFDREKVRCGGEVFLQASTEKIDNGTAIKWEIKQEGKTLQSIDGAINAASGHTTWSSKAQTDKRPEPPFSLTGSAAGLNASAAKEVTLKKYEDNGREMKSIPCSASGMAWTGKFDIELKEGQIVVTTKIKLVTRNGAKPAASTGPLPAIGPAVSAADKAAMKVDIESKLTDKRVFHRAGCKRGDGCDCPKARGCCKIRVKVVVDFVESGEHHSVNLFQGAGRANALNWTRVKTRENSYAHETGHLLGFYDEYADGAVGPTPRWKVQTGVIMSTGLALPAEYYWDFRDWLKGKCHGEDWTILLP